MDFQDNSHTGKTDKQNNHGTSQSMSMKQAKAAKCQKDKAKLANSCLIEGGGGGNHPFV